MKRILLAVTILVLVLPALRQVEARTEISVDFFYDNLGSDGNWVEVGDYGYCWQPTVAVSNSKWRPYSDGYWAYTDVGWTWVSNEDFGWATYHYGRWTRLRDRGWIWVPGREWGPAWVSWRTGGDAIGWAPIPPRSSGEVEIENRNISGQVDVEFDIGPEYYNFVDVRYIGEPLLRDRIYAREQNVTYISSTVNVTNITYTNSTVYNYGPDYNTVNRYSTHPIQRLTLQRDVDVDLSVAARSKALTRVQGDKLMVAAPLTLQKPSAPVAPKVVKEKIPKPNFEHGWTGDPKTQADLRQKMKTENPRNVPPPTVKARENAETIPSPNAATATSSTAAPPTAATAAPVTAASPAVSATPKAATPPAATVATTPAASSSPAKSPSDKRKTDRGEKPAPSITPSAPIAPSTTPAPTRNKPSDDRERLSPPSTPSSATSLTSPARDKAIKKDPRTEKPADISPATRTPADAPKIKPPPKPKDNPTPAPPNRDIQPDTPPKRPVPPEKVAPPKQDAPVEATHQPSKVERVAPPTGPGPNAPPKTEGPHNKPGPDHKKAEASATPGP